MYCELSRLGDPRKKDDMFPFPKENIQHILQPRHSLYKKETWNISSKRNGGTMSSLTAIAQMLRTSMYSLKNKESYAIYYP